MEDLESLIARTRNGDMDAYGQIARRFQDMAYGYAYSILGDFHLAEDAAQEAFLEAHRQLPKLREPSAFPGWFRRIVFKYCDRMTAQVFHQAEILWVEEGLNEKVSVEQAKRVAEIVLPEAKIRLGSVKHIGGDMQGRECEAEWKGGWLGDGGPEDMPTRGRVGIPPIQEKTQAGGLSYFKDTGNRNCQSQPEYRRSPYGTLGLPQEYFHRRLNSRRVQSRMTSKRPMASAISSGSILGLKNGFLVRYATKRPSSRTSGGSAASRS